MSILCCPTCGGAMNKIDKTYKCENGHSFDIAKEGYVNLLSPKSAYSKMPGDSSEMVASRFEFLSKGYYDPLRKAIANVVVGQIKHKVDCTVLDAGCGEGYYTKAMYDALVRFNSKVTIAGFDLSKYALKRVAKQIPNGEFAVASLFHLPVADKSSDILTDIFAPVCPEEFLRVLKDDGTLILAVPGERHLWGLKEALYEKPYLNDTNPPTHEGFKLIDKIQVKDIIKIDGNSDIKNLFSMTPYFWRTPKESRMKLDTMSYLETPIEFDIYSFKKEI